MIDDVRDLIEEVRRDGDAAVLALTKRFDGAELAPEQLRVDPAEVDAAIGVLAPGVLNGLRAAMANVKRVVDAQMGEPVTVDFDEGHRVEVVEVPVSRAGIYVPAGKAPYPSTVVMGAVTARAAGVDEVAVCAPPGPGGDANPVILAACALCRVDEVYRMGGAQAIAALAYGTESVKAVDVIAGPGNAWVQEAKRQVVGQVGIDGIAGPSELVVVASAGADPELIALDLRAQAEHGPDSKLAVIATERELLDAVVQQTGDQVEAVLADDARAALGIAEEMAPEHLELMGDEAEALAGEVRRAGCVFVGRDGATAFGDYIAGSNHILPTGGAARFQSALSASTFRRRMARVSFGEGAAARLAPSGAALARAEGFPVHAESMERRA